MLTIAICDNNPAVIRELTAMADRQLPAEEHQALGFETKKALVEALSSGVVPDIAFLDILFGTENGIDLAKERFPRGSRTQVIFVTGYVSHSAEVYETEHVFVLQKPVREELFRKAVEKARERLHLLERNKEQYLVLKTRETRERIRLDAIRYIESVGRKVEIHCQDKVYEQYTSLSGIAKDLTDGFVQCHKSFYVNMAYIRHIEPKCLLLHDGTEIPVSQTRKKSTREAVSRFWVKDL